MKNSVHKYLPSFLLTKEQQRQNLLNKVTAEPLKTYLSQPFPEKELSIKHTPILSVDFETTGLNAEQDQLLSIGCVELFKGKIKLDTCYHQIIKTQGQLHKANVVIHQITDDEKNSGIELNTAIAELLQRAAGKVLLVHFAKIERSFLHQACKQLYGVKPPLLIIDTLAVIKRRFDLSDVAYDPSRLRLINLRESFGLPGYHAHNALNDAIATAELLLAELHHHHQGLSTKWSSLSS